jgi:tripartite-type tricarboxylate transporter receptor subunit TctC
VYAHKDTPEQIQKTLYNGLRKICEDPAFTKGVEKIGEVPRFAGPEFVKDSVKKAAEVGIPIIKELGLYVGK